MVYPGHVVNGVIVLDDPLRLPEGTAVQVILGEPKSAVEQPRTAAKPIEQEIAEIVARVPTGEWARLPEDLTDHLDHYIYGTAKR